MTAIGGIGASAPGARSDGAVATGAGVDLRAVIWTGVVGVLLLAGLFVALGFLITGPLDSSVGHWDATVARWFFEQRTSNGNFWSAAGTWMAETPVVVGVGIVTALALAYRRRWHEVTLVVSGLLIEFCVYLVVVLAVDRPRPAHRLETRMTGSYPAGHVAAAVVLYGLLAFVLTRRMRSAGGRAAVWTVAVVVPFVVASSRLYRGMHHFSDVVAGAIIGLGALGVASLFARHVADPPQRGRDDRDGTPEGVAA
jgi:membrane-associated phospholipid phosphatase